TWPEKWKLSSDWRAKGPEDWRGRAGRHGPVWERLLSMGANLRRCSRLPAWRLTRIPRSISSRMGQRCRVTRVIRAWLHGGGWIIGFETGGFVRALWCRMRCDDGDSPSLAGDVVGIRGVLEPAGVNVFIVPSLWAPSLIVGLYSAEAGSRLRRGVRPPLPDPRRGGRYFKSNR